MINSANRPVQRFDLDIETRVVPATSQAGLTEPPYTPGFIKQTGVFLDAFEQVNDTPPITGFKPGPYYEAFRPHFVTQAGILDRFHAAEAAGSEADAHAAKIEFYQNYLHISALGRTAVQDEANQIPTPNGLFASVGLFEPVRYIGRDLHRNARPKRPYHFGAGGVTAMIFRKLVPGWRPHPAALLSAGLITHPNDEPDEQTWLRVLQTPALAEHYDGKIGIRAFQGETVAGIVQKAKALNARAQQQGKTAETFVHMVGRSVSQPPMSPFHHIWLGSHPTERDNSDRPMERVAGMVMMSGQGTMNRWLLLHGWYHLGAGGYLITHTRDQTPANS